MKKFQNRRSFVAALSASTLLASPWNGVLAADEWPNKPIKLMLGFPPGGGADAMARLIAIKMEKEKEAQDRAAKKAREAELKAEQEAVKAKKESVYSVQFAE